jgi:hypothetical protein
MMYMRAFSWVPTNAKPFSQDAHQSATQHKYHQCYKCNTFWVINAVWEYPITHVENHTAMHHWPESYPWKKWATKLGCEAGHLCGLRGVRREDWQMVIASPQQIPLAQGKLARSFLHSTPFIQWLVTVTSSFPIPTAKHIHSTVSVSRQKQNSCIVNSLLLLSSNDLSYWSMTTIEFPSKDTSLENKQIDQSGKVVKFTQVLKMNTQSRWHVKIKMDNL